MGSTNQGYVNWHYILEYMMNKKNKITILISVLLLLTIQSFAQDNSHSNPRIISLDFENKLFKSLPTSLKKGEFYQVKVDNINLNLYSVNIDYKDSTLEALDFPSFNFVGLENLTGILNELAPGEISSVLKGSKKAKMESLSPLPSEGFSDYLSKLDINLTSLEDSIITFQFYFSEQGSSVKQEIENLNNFVIMMESLIISHLVEGDKTWNENMQNDLTAEDIYKLSQSFRKRFQEIQRFMIATEKVYLAFYKRNQDEIDDDKNLKQKHEANTKLLAEIKKLAEYALGVLKPQAVQQWLKSAVFMGNTGYTYTSLPFQLKGDFTDLSIQIVPRTKEFGLDEYHTQIRLPKVSKWYYGVGTSLYSSNLSDDQYSVQTTTIDSTTSRFRVINEEQSGWEAGISTLFHVGGTIKSSNVGMHLSLGPSISLTKPLKPRLMAGGGLSFGKSNKLIFNGFIISGLVNRLSNSYKEGKTVIVDPADIPESVTVSKIGWGVGGSIGYLYTF